MQRFVAYLCLFPVCSCLSCSQIFEDRSGCPCTLDMIMTEIPDRLWNKDITVNLASEENNFFTAGVFRRSLQPDGTITETVPKSDISFSAISGIGNGRLSENDRKIHFFGEPDSLYCSYGIIDCKKETARDTLQLHKQWSTVYLVIAGDREDSPHKIRINSNWNGLSVTGCSPLKGKASYYARQIEHNLFSARILRQGDESLEIEMVSEDGETVCAWDLGHSIKEGRYDWFKDELDDVVAIVDCAASNMDIIICPWNDGTDFGDLEF